MSEFPIEHPSSRKAAFFEMLLASKYSNQISVFLASLSLLLWGVSIIQAKGVSMGDYGLFSVLPGTYYASVFLLITSMFYTVFSSKHHPQRNYMGIFLFQSSILMCIMLFTPTLIEGAARSPHSWAKYGYADYIVRNGHISQAVTHYHNWPAPFIFTAAVVLTSSMNPVASPAVFPLLLDCVVLMIVLLFFLRFFNDIRMRYFGIMLFFLLTWENQFHYIPQFFGFVLMLLLIYLCVFYLKRENPKMLIIIGMLFIILTMTHLLTAFVTGAFLGMLFILFFTAKIKKKKTTKRKSRRLKRIFRRKFWQGILRRTKHFLSANRRIVAFLVILSIGSLVAWYFFAQDWIRYVNWKLDLNIVPMLLSAYFEKLYTGSEAHGNLVLIRMVFSAFIALFAVIGGKLAYDRGHKHMMYALIVASIVPIFLFYYEVEIVQRTLLFCGLPVAALISLGLNKRKFLAAVMVLCFIAVPLHTLSMYGNEKLDYTPPSQISGALFVFDNVPKGMFVSGNPVQSGQYIERYSRTNIYRYERYVNASYEVYIVYSSSDRNFAIWYLGDETYISEYEKAINRPGSMLIFSSPDCSIYYMK